MTQAKQLSLFTAITAWAILVGGVMYSHIVLFPPYLSHLPESTKLITGDYGLHDEHFWLFAHPLTLLTTIIALLLNWKLKTRRKLILITLGIYALTIITTAVYFVPGLIAFADSNSATTVTPEEWFQRGQTWQHWSWIRGLFVFVNFLLMVSALTKDTSHNSPK